MEDRVYCSSSYLMYRTIVDNSKCFSEKYPPVLFERGDYRLDQIHDKDDLDKSLRNTVNRICESRRTAIALSGGIDSAILAKYMPKGATAYTFKCVVPGVPVTDETPTASKYAEECGLKHKIIEIYWEDFEKYAPILMKHKGAPIHSIEVQIYKAALRALEDGHNAIIYGESSDLNYGGLSQILSKDWTIGEFIDRYAYVKPYHVLREFELITDPITRYEENGYVNVHEFDRDFFLHEAMGSYSNACETAGIELCTPYERTWLAEPLDLERIRKGQNKYVVRELFAKLYPGYVAPTKTPMPRPMDEWFKNWKGPQRSEFWQNSINNMTGDQKFYVWALEQFLNLIEE